MRVPLLAGLGVLVALVALGPGAQALQIGLLGLHVGVPIGAPSLQDNPINLHPLGINLVDVNLGPAATPPAIDDVALPDIGGAEAQQEPQAIAPTSTGGGDAGAFPAVLGGEDLWLIAFAIVLAIIVIATVAAVWRGHKKRARVRAERKAAWVAAEQRMRIKPRRVPTVNTDGLPRATVRPAPVAARAAVIA